MTYKKSIAKQTLYTVLIIHNTHEEKTHTNQTFGKSVSWSSGLDCTLFDLKHLCGLWLIQIQMLRGECNNKRFYQLLKLIALRTSLISSLPVMNCA